jgi:hypothetical protein
MNGVNLHHRHIFRLLLFFPIHLFLIGQHIIAQESSLDCEVRGTWLNPEAFNSPVKRQETLQKLLEAHLNTVFVAVPPINNNYGWSDSLDFVQFISEVHSEGISVHIWVANLWRDGSGSVDFTNPIEQQAQTQWILDLMDTYGTYVSGIHFDYIRYNDWEPVNIGGKMDGITQTIESAYQALKSQFPDKFLTGTSFTLDPNYANYNDSDSSNDEDIPLWFLDWFYANPGNWFDIIYEDFDTVPLHMKYQQNPVGWTFSSIVDGVMPMQYSIVDSIWNNEIDHYESFLDTLKKKVYMGLGWLEEEGQSDWGYDPAGIVRKIKYGRSHGYKGFVIFQLGADGIDDTPLIDALTIDSELNDFDAPFKDYIPSCLMSFVMGTGEDNGQLPQQFTLFQNYPNPFNLFTTITYYLQNDMTVNISIYNVAGQLVETLVNEHKKAGVHTIVWNANNFGSGIYLIQMRSENFRSTQKALLLK